MRSLPEHRVGLTEIHIQRDVVQSLAVMNGESIARACWSIGQRVPVGGGGENLGPKRPFEEDAACPSTVRPNNLAHHRVTGQALCIVDILIARGDQRPTGATAHQAVDPILALTGVPYKTHRLIEKTKGFG